MSLIYVVLAYLILLVNAEQIPVTFTFKEYQYKDSPKNVRNINNFIRLILKGLFIN